MISGVLNALTLKSKIQMIKETKVSDSTTKPELYTLLGARGFRIGGRCKVFDALSWSKTGDVGNNECYYVDAIILSVGKTEFNEVTVYVLMANGRVSNGHFLEAVRRCV